MTKETTMPDTSIFTPHGRHLIAGDWVAGAATFRSEPAHGAAHDFAVGTPELVDRACTAAEAAFWCYGYATREARAAFLNAIADEIEARGDAITEIGTSETGLPEARLNGERGRTTHVTREEDAAPRETPLPCPAAAHRRRPKCRYRTPGEVRPPSILDPLRRSRGRLDQSRTHRGSGATNPDHRVPGEVRPSRAVVR